MIIEAILIACAVGAGGTSLGAAGALAVRNPKRKLSSTLLGLAGGIILSLVVLDMLPEAFEMGGAGPALAGFAAGVLVLFIVTKHAHGHHAHDSDEKEVREIARQSLLRTGVLLAAGMAVHNLPQGIAIGAGVESEYITGLAVLLFLHNIPEGMAMAIPLRIGGVRAGRIFFIAVLTAIPTVTGAVLGALVSGISEVFIAGSMAFAAGSMLYLTLRELIPQSAALKSPLYAVLAAAAGFAAGALLIWMLD